MLKKALIAVFALLFGVSLTFGKFYRCGNIFLSDAQYIEFNLKKEFGGNAVGKVEKIYKYIAYESKKKKTYFEQISFVADIMNILEKKRCYLDSANLEGNLYLLGKKMTYQLLRLKLDNYLKELDRYRFEYFLGIRD